MDRTDQPRDDDGRSVGRGIDVADDLRAGLDCLGIHLRHCHDGATWSATGASGRARSNLSVKTVPAPREAAPRSVRARDPHSVRRRGAVGARSLGTMLDYPARHPGRDLPGPSLLHRAARRSPVARGPRGSHVRLPRARARGAGYRPAWRAINLHRTWLAPDGRSKAPIDKPRRLLKGHRSNSEIRLWPDAEVTTGLVVGEGIE